MSKEDVLIHPCLYFYKNPKLPDPKVTYLKSLSNFISNENKNEAKRLLLSLDDTYKAFISALESTAVTEEGFILVFRDYVSVLLSLIDASHTKPFSSSISTNDLRSDPFGPDATQSTHQQNPPPPPAPQLPTGPLTGHSPLRYTIQFSWSQSLLHISNTSSSKSRCKDAVFELASSLIASAVWCIRRANALCESTPVGIASAPSLNSYKLLRQAAGLLEYVIASILPLLYSSENASLSPDDIGIDCAPEVLQATALGCLADAQAITVLRAIQKQNQPTLIASLARDARDQYTEAATALASFSSGTGAAVSSSTKKKKMKNGMIDDVTNSKLFAYFAYKQASFDSYCQIFNGIVQWKQGNAGAGVCCLKEAETLYYKAKKAAAVYDKAEPPSLGQLHRRFDDELDRFLFDSLRKIEKENLNVYYQPVPASTPPLPEPKRLSEREVFVLPEKSKIATEVDTNVSFTGMVIPPKSGGEGGNTTTSTTTTTTTTTGNTTTTNKKNKNKSGCLCFGGGTKSDEKGKYVDDEHVMEGTFAAAPPAGASTSK